jgi:hypothetical protein
MTAPLRLFTFSPTLRLPTSAFVDRMMTRVLSGA